MIDFENLAMVFIEPGKIAPEVDPRYYCALFPDLRNLSNELLKRHHDNHCRDEGRTGSPCDLRTNFGLPR